MASSHLSYEKYEQLMKRAEMEGVPQVGHTTQHAQGLALDRFFDVVSLDVALEVFRWLLPWDLLNLIITNKILRSTLMKKSTTGVWRAARQNVDVDFVIPDCPPDCSEPQWTHFLFTHECTECGALNCVCVDWTRRIRLCDGCWPKSYIKKKCYTEVGAPGGNDECARIVWDILPFFVVNDAGFRPETYFKADADKTFLEVRSYQKKIEQGVVGAKEELDDYVAIRLAEKAAIMEPYLKEWNSDVLMIMPGLIQKSHLLISEKLVTLGYDKRFINFDQHEGYFVHLETSLDYILNVMKPRMEEAKAKYRRAQEMQRKLLEAEMQRQVRATLKKQKKGKSAKNIAKENERRHRDGMRDLKRSLEHPKQRWTSGLDLTHKWLRCRICDGSRVFGWQGIQAHAEAAHRQRITPKNFARIVA